MDELDDEVVRELDDIYAELSNGCCSLEAEDLDRLDRRRQELEDYLHQRDREAIASESAEA